MTEVPLLNQQQGVRVVVWDRTDYLKETERQLSDEKTYKEIRITEKDQVELVEKSNNLFSNLRRKKSPRMKTTNLSLILKKQPI